MRYQHVRVVFAACLFAAVSAAQGTFDGSKTVGYQPVAYEPTGFGVARFDPSFKPVDSRSVDSGRPLAQPQDPQGQYEIRTIFQQVHGDFLSRMERYEPMMALGGRFLPNQSIQNEPGDFEQLDWFADASLPWNVSTDGYLLFGAYYEAKRYQFQNMGPGGSLNDETLTAGGLKFGFGAFIDDNILLEVETRPGVFSDCDGGLHHEDFDFPSEAKLTYRAIDNLFFKFGVRYNQVFAEAPWLPILGVSWDITGSSSSGAMEDRGGWRLDVLLPEHIEVSYWSSGSTGWLLGSEVTGAEYSVRTSAATGSERDNVRIQEVNAYFGMIHRMSDFLSLDARVGAVLSGNTEFTTGASGYDAVEGSRSPGFWCELSVGFDF